MIDRMNIGEVLKLLRIRSGLSQRQLGKKAMVCHASVYRYENNLADPPFSVTEDLLRAMGYRLEIVREKR